MDGPGVLAAEGIRPGVIRPRSELTSRAYPGGGLMGTAAALRTRPRPDELPLSCE